MKIRNLGEERKKAKHIMKTKEQRQNNKSYMFNSRKTKKKK